MYSHIISNLPDLEMTPDLNPINVNVCDISNLYQSQEVLKHRISYWKEETGEEVIAKLTKLEKITNVHELKTTIEEDADVGDYELKKTINLDAFLNHNYRAFSNILSKLIDEDNYYDIIHSDFGSNSTSNDWQKVSTIVFLTSLIYRKVQVWNTMGFGCKDFDTIDYPTTLNRLILNYLYLSKKSQDVSRRINRRIEHTPSSQYVSLKELLDIFGRASFIPTKTDSTEESIEQLFAKFSIDNNTQTLIIDRLANMCARNPMSIHSKSYGYDSQDNELWRRPLYFIGGIKVPHTAASNVELSTHFRNAILNNQSSSVLFSITDEGYILIRDFVKTFEFYSARYCNEDFAIPLHQAKTTDQINALIEPVYFAVQRCCKRNGVFRQQYIIRYGIEDDDNYFYQFFHPRTNPRFEQKHYIKSLRKNTFRPQLHIVRVIYNHITYFDDVKDMIYNTEIQNKDSMCETLTNWIERYLSLYKTYFFSIVENTVCNSDNNVYNNLLTLLDEQKKHYGKDGDYMNVRINSTVRKKE